MSVAKILIVGGVAGGASAAARARRLNETAEIILFERGPDVSFANCGLPYYVGGEISEREQLLVAGDRQLKSWLNLDVRRLSEVVAIDRERKEVEVRNHESGETYREPYDYLIISTGAAPIRPNSLLEKVGPDHPRVLSLRNLEDVDRIKEVVEDGTPTAVVIGGGFIGLEVAEQLVHRGINTSLVELLPQVMPPFDAEMVAPLHEELVAKGVDLHLGDGVADLEREGAGIRVALESGESLSADFVLLSIGVRPESDLARDAGLELTDRGAIKVDEGLLTSDPDIYAVGDAIEVKEPIFGGSTFVPLGGPANRQGRLAADRISVREGATGFKDESLEYRGTQGTSVVRVFDLAAGMTGMTEKALERLGKKRGQDYAVVYAHPNQHAGYYPGATAIALKLVYELPGGRILGAQAVGRDGVDKRIDVIAMGIQMGATVFDLEQTELCYAPPFGSAKDPVNMVGFMAANSLRGMTTPVHVDDLPPEATVLDVRTDPENAIGAIPDALHIPLEELRSRLEEVPKEGTVVTYCKVGLRGYLAERILRQNGFDDVRNLSGGFSTWEHFHPRDLNVKGPSTEEQAPADADSAGESAAREDAPVASADPLNAELLDARGLQCPGPLMQVAEKMPELSEGAHLRVLASDPGFPVDIEAWCRSRGHTFVTSESQGTEVSVLLQSGQSGETAAAPAVSPDGGGLSQGKGQTIVVFSGEWDRVMAAFVIANGAAAMGHPVTMFFTFWGLNALRKNPAPKVDKAPLERMFSLMMPQGVDKLPLSTMHMGGLGKAVMNHVVDQKNVTPLDELMKQAQQQGVRLIACTMSMGLMGITEEELIEGLDYAGVGAYIGAAENAGMNLFI